MSEDEQHHYDAQQEAARKAAYEDAIRTINGVRVRTRGGRALAARWSFPAHSRHDEWGFPIDGEGDTPFPEDTEL